MKNLSKIIFVVTLLTFVSKIFALISVQLYTSFFGADDLYLRVFNYSMNIPNTIFTCIGTAITTIFVPIYSSHISKKDYKKAQDFLNNIITITTIIITFLLIISYFLMPHYLNLSSYRQNKQQYDYALFAICILMPTMYFTNFSFIFQGILQTNNKFKLIAFISFPSSFATILYIIFGAKYYGVTGLIITTFLGFLLQVLILVPSLRKLNIKYKFSCNLKDEDIIKSAKLTCAVLLGILAHQINMLYNNNLSTRFGVENILFIVQNIIVNSIFMFVYSIISIYYPKLSIIWHTKTLEEYKKVFSEVIILVIFLLLPLSVGVMLLNFEIINLTSNWGKFGMDDTLIASNMIYYYGIGVLFIGMKEVFDRALYSQKVTLPSAIVAVVIMITNILVSYFLKDIIFMYSIPFAYSVSSFVGAVCLFKVLLNKKCIQVKIIVINFFKCVLCALIMGIFVYYIKQSIILVKIENILLYRITILFVPIIFGACIYFFMTYVFNVLNVRNIINKFLKINM